MPVHAQSIAGGGQDPDFRFRYETLRALLKKNGGALQVLSDLEADLNHLHHYDKRIRHSIQHLLTETLLMAQELNLLTGNRHADLYRTIFNIGQESDRLFSDETPAGSQPLVVGLENLERPDPGLLGGKAHGLWRLAQYFKDSIPAGFVVTTAAYHLILEHNHLHDRIRILLNNLDVTEDPDQFKLRTQTIRNWIHEASVPPELRKAIRRQITRIASTHSATSWAVRSSAVYEDSNLSFAGQFESELNIDANDLVPACLKVLAGRFTDRAVKYRIHNEFREVDTPMAVLFMPMVTPAAAGVVTSMDPEHPEANTLVISAVPGLADKMVRGEERAHTWRVDRSHPHGITEGKNAPSFLSSEKVIEIAKTALEASGRFGQELEMEWAVDQSGKLHLLQARPLSAIPKDETIAIRLSKKDTAPILEGGVTIFPGRAEGPVVFVGPDGDGSNVPEGAVVVVEHPKPEFASMLPGIAALLAMEGNPVGHLATMAREFSVPCIFQVGPYARLLMGREIVSVNATKRTVYDGPRWPGMRERVLARIAAAGSRRPKPGPLHDLILGLNLLDPDAPSFKAKSCKSVHDTLRFMHEMSVRSMFGFGDRQSRGLKKKSRRLNTGLPLKIQLIDLDRSISPDLKKITPEDVRSAPFRALWRGIADQRLAWPERWKKEMMGMPSDFKEAVLGGTRGPRRTTDTNYAIVAGDYINLNARMAYHYMMVDAMVGDGSENNHIHFRVRGGGASDANRKRRARFLERVLRQLGFGVDRREDLVTAWLRRYPRTDSEKALTLLGRLIVCARQLDVVLKTDAAVKRYTEAFIKEQYGIFR